MNIRQSAADQVTARAPGGMGEGPATTAARPALAEPRQHGREFAEGSRLARLLINRDFAIFSGGAFISATGSWFQVVALGWLVVSVGGRNAGFLLGLVGFASLMPILVLGLVGGLLADRLNRRLLLLGTGVFNAVALLVLAFFTATNRATPPVILAFALIMGIVSALTWPTWQALINDLVAPRDLPRAIAFNSARFNMTRVIGPAVGGALLTLIGPAWCFTANAATTIGVSISLIVLRLPPPPRPRREPLRDALLGGLIYARTAPRARTILLATAALGMLGFPYNSFLPAFAKGVLHAGPGGLGLLLTAVGAGALFGAITSGASWVIGHRRQVLAGALALFGLADAAFAASPALPLSMAALAVLGFAMLLYLSTANTALQSEAPPAVLGRLMGVWVIVTSGATPLGSLAMGALTAATSVQVAVGLGGAACVVGGLLLSRTTHLA